ncbi:MAG: DUF2817 domain-containing protein [Deltaproteobacteria bacterium]|nr:DUF2817 domain-containing protein [Deltaproteobacteria bacterium]
MGKEIVKLVAIAFFVTAAALPLIGYLQTWPPKRAPLIPIDYFQLRKEFIRNARNSGAQLTSVPIAAKGPGRQELAIDIAWFGSRSPDNVLLHISGTHGVEGYPGSAIQSAILQDGVKPPRLNVATCGLLSYH